MPVIPSSLDADVNEAAGVNWVRTVGWEIRRPPRAAGVGWSLAIHAVIMGVLLFGDVRLSRDGEARPTPSDATRVFATPPVGLSAATDLNRLAKADLASLQIDKPSSSFPDVAVLPSSIELRFALDTSNQLPEVVRQYGVMLVLAEKQDPTLTRYIFRGPDWQMQESVRDVSGHFKVLMDPAREWVVFRDLSRRHALALDLYFAYAVFDLAYRGCLQSQIQHWLVAHPVSIEAGRISAYLSFQADKPCGVNVLEVSHAVLPARSR